MRVNILIPEELKARMDEVSEVNWSEVARIAISEELRRLEGSGLSAHEVGRRLLAGPDLPVMDVIGTIIQWRLG